MKLALIILSFSLLCACSEKDARVQELPEKQPNDSEFTSVYYPGGELLKMQGKEINGKKEGEWRSWYEDGTQWSLTTFKEGIKEGKTITWFENGQMRYQGSYTNDQRSGKWTFYDQNGQLVKEIDYQK